MPGALDMAYLLRYLLTTTFLKIFAISDLDMMWQNLIAFLIFDRLYFKLLIVWSQTSFDGLFFYLACFSSVEK